VRTSKRKQGAPKSAVGKKLPAHKSETWEIGRLKPYANNTRKHSAEQIEKIRASMREFGWTIPVLVREDGTLIAGHGRLKAAVLEGITQVPVIVARGWTEEQCRAYSITDNRLSEESEWDDALLKIELGALQAAGYDLSATAFDGDDLSRLITLPADALQLDGGAGEMSPVIQFNIVFDTEAQQELWFAFVRQLKTKYPNEETLGARLALYLPEIAASAAG
jgi:ParB-like chromosome segregation protein Spo0J